MAGCRGFDILCPRLDVGCFSHKGSPSPSKATETCSSFGLLSCSVAASVSVLAISSVPAFGALGAPNMKALHLVRRASCSFECMLCFHSQKERRQTPALRVYGLTGKLVPQDWSAGSRKRGKGWAHNTLLLYLKQQIFYCSLIILRTRNTCNKDPCFQRKIKGQRMEF